MQITPANYGFFEQHPRQNFSEHSREKVMQLYGLSALQYSVGYSYFVNGVSYPYTVSVLTQAKLWELATM